MVKLCVFEEKKLWYTLSEVKRLRLNLSVSVTICKTVYLKCKYSPKKMSCKTTPSNVWCHLRSLT